jgi:hypothetical protein
LKEAIEFSLMAVILRSDDCNTFIPCPLCPITRNFGTLYAPLPKSTPTHQTILRSGLDVRNMLHDSNFTNINNKRIFRCYPDATITSVFTFGEASGVERDGGILLDLVEVWDVGDMDSFESHLLERERKRGQRRNFRDCWRVEIGEGVFIIEGDAGGILKGSGSPLRIFLPAVDRRHMPRIFLVLTSLSICYRS